MSRKLKAGVLGATGAAGQEFLEVLQDHPYFEINAVFASTRSAGKRMGDLKIIAPLEPAILDMVVQDGEVVRTEDIDILFSAIEMPRKEDVKTLEGAYARHCPVISVNSAWRYDPLVPVIIPEVNGEHAAMIKSQQKQYGWKGFIAPGPNCTSVGPAVFTKCMSALSSLKNVAIVSMQSASGAGRGAVLARRAQVMEEAQLLREVGERFSAKDHRRLLEQKPRPKQFQANVITRIDGEEDKVKIELKKMLGTCLDSQLYPLELPVSARCYRTSQERGHLVDVALTIAGCFFEDEVLQAISNFNALMHEAVGELPSSPGTTLQVEQDLYGPQPLYRVGTERGMVTFAGKIEVEQTGVDTVIRAAVLSDNLGKGASRGAVHTAEYLWREYRDLVLPGV